MTIIDHARTLSDVLQGHAAARADKIAFETVDGHEVTFGDFNKRVNRLCNAASSLGLRKGARVAILSLNRPEYVEVYGVAKSGLIVVPLNWRLAPGELVKLLAHSAPDMLIVDEANLELVESIRSALPSVSHYVLLGEARSGWTGFEALLACGSDEEPIVAATPDDILCLIYTSGTTGEPKGVAITHSGALGNSRAAATDILSLTDRDRTMAVMPLFHAGGMWYHLFPSFLSGCTTLILAEFEPPTVLRELEARRISNVHLVPTMIGSLLAHPSAKTADLSHLRILFYAASSMPAILLRQAMQVFSQCGFVQSYGSTEAGVISVFDSVTHLRALTADNEHLLLACGRPIVDREVLVLNEDGHSLSAGEVGEIVVRSKSAMKGYWHNEEATYRVMRNGWLKTGDLGYFDSEGFLYIVDRTNDMIVTGGENVFPTEVEGLLYGDPDVLEAAVFGIPDPVWVEKVVAAVVLKTGSGVSSEEIINRLRGRLASYKCPKTIFFTSALPKNALGKVLRKELRKQYSPKG
ncbi:long-chain-fatty-acid--CoA ligase [Caballeronia sp. S22]|uniref:long-chain-fatty-acid--CoA ligase n=1 Tax=Caballeronia sp. S22 TaxID=3137182 RepID=UPI00353119BB